MKNKRIAILGAGGLGACTALELAQRGYSIDLYEKHSEPIRKASFVNEGKIHLGFIYALDKDLYTARQMIIGAVHFISNLKRWISIKPEEVISTPFYYCNHRGSLSKGDELGAHYQKCAEIFDEVSQHYDKKYLDFEETIFSKRLSQSEMEGMVNPEYFQDVFQTNEYSVEPRIVASLLTEALLEEPKIRLHVHTTVQKVERNGTSIRVHFEEGESLRQEEYDEVINCTWNSLLRIDQTMGIEPLYNWSFRYKYGNKILIPFGNEDFPSCTMVQGPYGDCVNFRDRGGFFSWYPIGRTGWSEGKNPPDWDQMYSQEERFDIFKRSFEELKKRVPALRELHYPSEKVDPAGGIIFALGNTDVDNSSSKLHTRHEVGIRSFDGYHSVNTGKYTLIPLLALQLANRIDGRPEMNEKSTGIHYHSNL
ncbi:FAD dependent oxidoreductase [Algoriphagus boseongensis]|uniref:FAD dependent oxidoreductase n=1 Tax=Algoriphagus boseongensis TaxID=1442587 RepID=A0A4R6T6X2_9BACT|nr:FAD-dependent oxidoreductase [Algoriphagus boseongensis]TDQ16945.1 FAD dependent oxidoreductase [Algoriphagus boseongensis]